MHTFNCWFKPLIAAKPVEVDVILADAKVETNKTNANLSQGFESPLGLQLLCNQHFRAPHHDKAHDSVC